MSDHNTHHARLSRLRTTSQLLRRTTTLFTSHPLTFLFLTSLLFSFHSLIDHSSHLLTSFIDKDPSIRTLLSRLPQTHSPNPPRTPFLQLTRLGTLDDDFFSTDPHQDSSFPSPVNSTTVLHSGFHLISGLSRPITDNGLLLPQIIRSGFKGQIKENNAKSVQEKLLFKVADVTALLYLVTFLSTAYGWVILVFTTIYSFVLAVMFVTVINDVIGRYLSFVEIVNKGTKLAFKRVTGFVLMRWALRDALTQFLGLCYFGEVEDQYSFFRLFVRLKLMPFTVMPQWIKGYEEEISGFLFAWFLLDTLIGLILAVDGFVAIVNPRRRGRDILKEGLYLVSILFHQAVQLKCLEAILCGSFFRWGLIRFVGKGFASVIQSGLEVYFMAAWLVFYLASRCKDAHKEGRRFGRREMENLVDGIR